MGCCASTNKPPPSPEFHRHSSKSSRAPPPVDEETVKEVLSETPNPKHFSKIEDNPRKITPRQSFRKIQQQDNNLKDINLYEEVSEICSTVSESVSTTTFEDDFEILRRKMTNRSPAKLRNRQPVLGELRTVGKSPMRGKEQSPGRVRSLPGRDSRGTGFGPVNRQFPGSGYGSAPRSRSPANRTVAGGGGDRNVIGRSPSARKTGRSPGRVGSDLHERVRKPDVRSGRERDESSCRATAKDNDESLENPLVSLECFIFL